MEIVPFRSGMKWLLAAAAPVANRSSFVAAAFWSHPQEKWVVAVADATEFETEAASLVYRKGNLERMSGALENP